MSNYTYPYSPPKIVVGRIEIIDYPDREGLTTTWRIKRIKREVRDEGYEFDEIRKGFFKVDNANAIYPVLWFRHKTYLNDHGNSLRKTVCVAPAQVTG